MTRLLLLAALACLSLLSFAAGASAHVTLQPSEAASGGFAGLVVRVPNERDDAGTTKVDVQFPDGVITASYAKVPGWNVTVKKSKLDKPVKVEGFDVEEQISQMTWESTSKDAVIAPGQFQDFPISLRVPEGDAGTKLTFKALQTYEGGEVVRWIGSEDSDEPAPTLTLTAAEGSSDSAGHHDGGASAAAPGEQQEQAAPGPPAEPSPSGDDGDGAPMGLVIAALVAGVLGLAVGTAGLLTARRAAAA